MISWKPYILSILVCSMICGIVSAMLSDTKRKHLIHLICGVVMILSILGPLTHVNPEYLQEMERYNRFDGEFYISEGKKAAVEQRERCIIDCCETYILDKTKILGWDTEVEIRLDELQIPVFAEIKCMRNEKLQLQLQEILEKDLGIPKENQTWIWNQENNSS